MGTRHHHLTIYVGSKAEHAPPVMPADSVEDVGDLAEREGVDGVEQLGDPLRLRRTLRLFQFVQHPLH